MINILEEAKKIFLAGIGAAAMTYDKSIDLVNHLVTKGKLTVDEGKELSEELKKEVKLKAENIKVMTNERLEEIKPITKEDIQNIFKELNFVTRDEITEIKTKIKELEDKIQK